MNNSSDPLKILFSVGNENQIVGFEVLKERLSAFCGVHDKNLCVMSQLFGHRVCCRGNLLSIESPNQDVQRLFRSFVSKVMTYMEQGIEVQTDLLDALYCASNDEYRNQNSSFAAELPSDTFYNPQKTVITINGKKILARNRKQHKLLQQLSYNDAVSSLGPAGTGKTFLTVAYSLSQLMEGQASMLLLSRPVVEAGESLGLLLGDFGQKIGSYMMPLFDYLLESEQVTALQAKGMIEVAPLAYMCGHSRSRCY